MNIKGEFQNLKDKKGYFLSIPKEGKTINLKNDLGAMWTSIYQKAQ